MWENARQVNAIRTLANKQLVNLDHVTVIDPRSSADLDQMASLMVSLGLSKGMTHANAMNLLERDLTWCVTSCRTPHHDAPPHATMMPCHHTMMPLSPQHDTPSPHAMMPRHLTLHAAMMPMSSRLRG